MDERLKQYVKELFETAPRSRAAMELQEEITSNCIEKYHDLTDEGIADEDAYRIVIEGIGNVRDLFQDMTEDAAVGTKLSAEALRRKTAILTSASVGMYIFAAVLFLGMTILLDNGGIGLIAGITVAIVPTCLLVYQAIAYPNYEKSEETIVENFKEWDHGSKQRRMVRGAVSSVVWTVCLIAYFLVSFTTGAWYITWVLFLVASCVEGIITLIFYLKQEQ